MAMLSRHAESTRRLTRTPQAQNTISLRSESSKVTITSSTEERKKERKKERGGRKEGRKKEREGGRERGREKERKKRRK